MSHRLTILPQGSLGLVATASAMSFPVQPSEIASEIVTAFDQSLAGGLTTLASNRWQSAVQAGQTNSLFGEDYTRNYFVILCRQCSSTSKQKFTVAPPDTATMEEWLHLAPPMPGLEYLNPLHLQRLWSEIDAYAQVAANGHDEGLAGFLKSIDANWNLIGRVTFHLAEKQKESRCSLRIHGYLHTRSN